MSPESFERLGPFMQRPDTLGIGAIKHIPPMPSHSNQSDFVQHTEMLGNRWLFDAEGHDDVAHRALLLREVVEDLAASGFGYSIESVGSGCSSRHKVNIFLYGNMSSVFLKKH